MKLRRIERSLRLVDEVAQLHMEAALMRARGDEIGAKLMEFLTQQLLRDIRFRQ